MNDEFVTLAENSPDGIARFDQAGRFTYVNHQTERILGRSREEILGKTNHDLGVPRELADQARQDIQQVIETGKPLRRTYQAAKTPHAQSVRVLIVDDHAIFREGLARLLENHPHFEVLDEAENGLQALEKVRRLQPDLVLMDCAMPKLDGVEATRRIVADHPDVSVVALSMYHEEGMSYQMLKAGAQAFVQKTAPVSELLATVQRVRDNASPTAS